MPFGHTSPAPFGGTLPKGEGLGVVVLNNHLAVFQQAAAFSLSLVNVSLSRKTLGDLYIITIQRG